MSCATALVFDSMCSRPEQQKLAQASIPELVYLIIDDIKQICCQVVKTTSTCISIVKEELYAPPTRAQAVDQEIPISQHAPQTSTSDPQFKTKTATANAKPKTLPRYMTPTTSSLCRNQAIARQHQGFLDIKRREKKYPRWHLWIRISYGWWLLYLLTVAGCCMLDARWQVLQALQYSERSTLVILFQDHAKNSDLAAHETQQERWQPSSEETWKKHPSISS